MQFEYVNLGEKPNEELEITSVVEDSPGVFWIGTETGLFRRNRDGKAERFTVRMAYHTITYATSFEIRMAPWWIATGLGLCRLKSDIRDGV